MNYKFLFKILLWPIVSRTMATVHHHHLSDFHRVQVHRPHRMLFENITKWNMVKKVRHQIYLQRVRIRWHRHCNRASMLVHRIQIQWRWETASHHQHQLFHNRTFKWAHEIQRLIWEINYRIHCKKLLQVRVNRYNRNYQLVYRISKRA